MSQSRESGHGVVTVDVDGGRLILLVNGSAVVAVPVDSLGGPDDAGAWVAAADRMSAQVDVLASVSVRASEVGLVAVDAAGTVVHPVLWAHDDRSAPDAAWCRKKHDDAWWEAEVGSVPEPRHLVTKLSWLHRSAPDAWDRSRFFCSLEDYLRWHLVSGGVPGTYVTRPSVAAAFGLWGHGEYRQSVLSLIDDARDWSGVLPEVAAEGTKVGTWHQVEVLL